MQLHTAGKDKRESKANFIKQKPKSTKTRSTNERVQGPKKKTK